MGMIMALVTLLGPGFIRREMEAVATDLLLLMAMHFALVSMTSIWASHAHRLAMVNACLFVWRPVVLLAATAPTMC
jgi:hypothetical protein